MLETLYFAKLTFVIFSDIVLKLGWIIIILTVKQNLRKFQNNKILEVQICLAVSLLQFPINLNHN